MDLEQIPDELRRQHQWITWRVEERDGTETKVPIDPTGDGYASVADPVTWTSYEMAADAYRDDRDIAGLGYVFVESGPYLGVDLDDCRDPDSGDLAGWAGVIMNELDSYTEVSPSGTGLHVLLEGSVPNGGYRKDGVEMYDHRRFFTVTGDHVPGTSQQVEERREAIQRVHAEYIAPDEKTDEYTSQSSETAVTLEDEEILEKALNAANADKFRQLWIGDTSGYRSHSEADQALCNFLAFWSGGDEAQMERLFGQSGLVREKWRNREDYRERTIRKAVKGTREYYEPPDGES